MQPWQFSFFLDNTDFFLQFTKHIKFIWGTYVFWKLLTAAKVCFFSTISFWFIKAVQTPPSPDSIEPIDQNTIDT